MIISYLLHTEITPAVGLISSSIVGTGKRICFAAEVESEIPRQLHRAPTPYPKELRNLARHARNLQHQSAHDQRVNIIQYSLLNVLNPSLSSTTYLCIERWGKIEKKIRNGM